MEQQTSVDGNSVDFKPKPTGEHQDCTIELEMCQDFGSLDLKDVQMGQGNQSLFSLRQMVQGGRPAVVIIMPSGLKFEASSMETFYESMKRLSALRPVIVVFGGK